MKKIYILGTTLLLSSLLFVSCSATNGVNVDSAESGYTHFQNMPLNKVHKAIVDAAQEDGWRTTEFKENVLIAEKTISEGDTKAVTVKFSQNYFTLEPKDSDLQNAIDDKLGL
jgi:PBP1b-binding outer membrane lipoprotein LpoB